MSFPAYKKSRAKLEPDWECGTIESLDEFDIVVQQRRIVFVKGIGHNKPLSSVFVANMVYSRVRHYVGAGCVCTAKEREATQ